MFAKAFFLLCGMTMLAFPFLGGAYIIAQMWPAAVPSVVELRNDALVPLTKILPADPAQARSSDGVAFYSASFQALNAGEIARVRVSAAASASEPNVAVVAVFLAGEAAPIKIVSKPVSGNKREWLELSADVPAYGIGQMSFEFRIGPAEPGTIVFNGPDGASERAVTIIRITE
jgi:hypothetical protein